MPTVGSYTRLCYDEVGVIISYLPIDKRRRLTKAAYISHVAEAMKDPVRFGRVLATSGGLLPHVIIEMAKAGYNMPCVDDTMGFGEECGMFDRLLRILRPRYVTHVPSSFVHWPGAKQTLHEVYPYGPYTHLIGPSAIRLCIINDFGYKYTCNDLSDAICIHPDLAAYNCDAYSTYSLSNCFDFESDDTYDEDNVVRRNYIHDVVGAMNSLVTIRGHKRAARVLLTLMMENKKDRDEDEAE